MQTATRIGVLATVLCGFVQAQPAPPTVPASCSCGQARPSSTFITANAVIEVKDIPLCFDPAYIEITHPEGQGTVYGHFGVIADITPSVGSTGAAPAPMIVSVLASGNNGWSRAAVVNFSGEWTSPAQLARPVALGTGSSYAVSVLNPPQDLASAFSLPYATTILGFRDINGRSILIPADPSLPQNNGDWKSEGRGPPFNLLLHADQLGTYVAALTVSGRWLRAIIMRSRRIGVLSDPLSAHHHIQLHGAAAERADIDLDDVGVRSPALYPSSSTEPACAILGRRPLADAPVSDSRATTATPSRMRPAELTPVARVTMVHAILPLRI